MKRGRILVVDDDVKWLENLTMFLGDDYELSLTTDPAEALSLMKSISFSLAILDQRISPDVSGVDLLVRMKEIRPALRGIILTGYADLDDAVESMQTGAFDYLSKGKRDLGEQLRQRVAKALAPNPYEQPLAALLQQGESAKLEFKSSARWDKRLNRLNHDLESVVVKTVCAFLNSEGGGTLLLGVDDSGAVVGLQEDYKTLKKQNRDGYENFLTTLLLGAYGKDVSPHLRIDFHDVDGQDVCRISVTLAARPVFFSDGSGEHFYIRAGNSTRLLTSREVLEYCRTRWK